MKEMVAIQGRMGMGMTQPFLCQAAEGQRYIVKTKAMMPLKQLLAEYIGSEIARQLDLPCPPFELVSFHPTLIGYAPAQWRCDLTECLAFASRFVEQAHIAKTAQAQNPHYLPEIQQKWLYMFDRWILNTDRTASKIGTGNINLLFDEADQRILVIDHNLAFDEDEQYFDAHLFAPTHRKWRLDWVDKASFTEKAIDILQRFHHICQAIPDCWIADEEEYDKFEHIIRNIQRILARIDTEHYWNNIL